MPKNFVASDQIRALFSAAMSEMYRAEVPLYGDLLEIVGAVNACVLDADRALSDDLQRRGEIDRFGTERHGAIRVGTAAELSLMRRAFAVMGMVPVGYYDLAVAGVPVHSTAFRPVDPGALNRNPLRIFTSLLRLDLIEDDDLRAQAERILAGRQIVSDAAITLVERNECEGGLGADDAHGFVAELLETFRWHSEAIVDFETYHRLNRAHRLVADVVAFKGSHINHLTPRVLDIDAAQAEMPRRGIKAKAVVEGPPRRKVPILLRQTSFTALAESVRFRDAGDPVSGTHTARFGEIEQRGVALTPKGFALYDDLLDEARGDFGSQMADYAARLTAAFADFPDSEDELRRQDLAYFRYRLADGATASAGAEFDLDSLIAAGAVLADPVIYEDFLPVSAAGIFQSNIGGQEQRRYDTRANQAGFEHALGSPVIDPFELYEATQRHSLDAVRAAIAARATG